MTDIIVDLDLESVNSTTISEVLTQLKLLGDNNKYPPKVNNWFKFTCHFLLLQDTNNGTKRLLDIVASIGSKQAVPSFDDVSLIKGILNYQGSERKNEYSLNIANN